LSQELAFLAAVAKTPGATSAMPARIKPIMRGMPIKLEAGKPMRY
jgi:hypothetical protein